MKHTRHAATLATAVAIAAVMAAATAYAKGPDDDGAVTAFNGKDLSGFKTTGSGPYLTLR